MDSAKCYLTICLKPLPASAASAGLLCFSPVERLGVSEGEKTTKAETQGEGKHCEVMSLFPHRSFMCSRSISGSCCSLSGMPLQNLGESVFLLSSLPSFQAHFHLACYWCGEVALCTHFELAFVLYHFCSLSLLVQAYGLSPGEEVSSTDFTWWSRKGFAPSHLSHQFSVGASSRQVRSWAGSQPLTAPLPGWAHG